MPLGSLAPAQFVLSRALDRWALESQTRARRNAMVAMTALAERRAEREDVEAYLAATARPRLPRDAAVAGDRATGGG